MKKNWKYYTVAGISSAVWIYTIGVIAVGMVPYVLLIPVSVVNMIAWMSLLYTIYRWYTGHKLVLMVVPENYEEGGTKKDV